MGTMQLPVVKEGMICKYTIKVFKMLHPNIDNSIIVCKAGTKHGVDCGTSMSLSFTNLSQQINHIHTASDAAPILYAGGIVLKTA